MDTKITYVPTESMNIFSPLTFLRVFRNINSSLIINHECIAAEESASRISVSSLFLSFHNFLLERCWLGESNSDFVGCQFVVELGHSVKLVFNLLLVEWVDEYLDVFLSIKSHSGRFSSDCGWVALY